MRKEREQLINLVKLQAKEMEVLFAAQHTLHSNDASQNISQLAGIEGGNQYAQTQGRSHLHAGISAVVK
jgi:hypothetical protein